MAEIKWIKICTDIFDDEKILLIESKPEKDSIIVVWFKLLCLAGKQNNSGVFIVNDKIAYTDEMLATIFRRPLDTVKNALDIFEQYGMIEIIDGTITIPNWEKHQNLDALERYREGNRKRVAKHRDKQKKIIESCNVTGNVNDNVTVTSCNAIDKKEDIDKNNINNNCSIFSKLNECVSDENDVIADKLIREYMTLYKHFTGYEHPNLKDEQLKHIKEELLIHMGEYCLEPEDISKMIIYFFEKPPKGSDGNINLFISKSVFVRTGYSAGTISGYVDF